MSRTPASWSEVIAEIYAERSDPNTVADICSVLENRRRQLAVVYLLLHGEDWTSMADLARWITAVMNDVPLEDATGPEFRSVKESLRHTHLETLDDADVIRYEDERGRATAGERLELVGRVYLHLLMEPGYSDPEMS